MRVARALDATDRMFAELGMPPTRNGCGVFLTETDMAAALQAFGARMGREAAVKVLARYRAKRLRDVPPDRWGDLHNDLKALPHR